MYISNLIKITEKYYKYIVVIKLHLKYNFLQKKEKNTIKNRANFFKNKFKVSLKNIIYFNYY